MKPLNREQIENKRLPIRVVQFGEGNFLRAFTDWVIDILNEKARFNAGVAVVQPIEHGMVSMLNDQDGLYFHLIRGLQDGKEIDSSRLITCIQQGINPYEDTEGFFQLAELEELQFIISNTTEAGIHFDENDHPTEGALAKTFPGKLTQLLKKRFDFYGNNPEKGLIIIPCELIENNGKSLKHALHQYADLWGYGNEFKKWIDSSNHFCNTLVDRIVPGFPKNEIDEIRKSIGFDDQLVVLSEVFHLWVIEGSETVRKAFPADLQGLEIKFVKDITPYRTRKVRILNGCHTAMVPIGLLAGLATVKETLDDDKIGPFLEEMIEQEILPTIDLPLSELVTFKNQVIERFKNPFIRHELKSIALNSISKYGVRILPTVKDYYEKKNQLPEKLVFSLACLIKLYLSDQFEINDDPEIMDHFKQLRRQSSLHEVVEGFLGKGYYQLPENLLSEVRESLKTNLHLLESKPIMQML